MVLVASESLKFQTLTILAPDQNLWQSVSMATDPGSKTHALCGQFLHMVMRCLGDAQASCALLVLIMVKAELDELCSTYCWVVSVL